MGLTADIFANPGDYVIYGLERLMQFQDGIITLGSSPDFYAISANWRRIGCANTLAGNK
jgi:hypothetical protein